MTADDLIPTEAEGFHAFTDAFALDDSWVIFLSLTGHKDALKAIRAMLFTNRWVNAGIHDFSLLPRAKYMTITRTLSTGTPHMAIYLKAEGNSTNARYALSMDANVHEPDLYFEALVNHSAVPVHPGWKAWLHKRAREEKEIETLTAHRIQGIKVCLNDAGLAEDISKALRKGGLKRSLEPNQLSLDCGKMGP